MAGAAASGDGGTGFPWRIVGWGGAGLLLLLPLLANAPWTAFDFIVAAAMLGTTGLLLELAVRASASLTYRAGAGVAILASVLLFWVNGAVGFLGDEDNPANLVFAAVIAVAALGAILARFKATGMSRAMFAAAGVQLLIGAIAIPMGWASPGNAGLFEVLMGTTLFTSLWLLSAALFRKAAA